MLGAAFGCARPELMDWKVRAGSSDDLAAFRSKLTERFSSEELRPFDTALQELKLQAMNSGVSGTAAREEAMRDVVNGKTLREAIVLGWQARRARLKRELDDMRGRLEHDSQLQQKAVSADSVKFFTNLINNERDLVAQLERDLADAEARLKGWGATAL
jgi:hypothetical protein